MKVDLKKIKKVLIIRPRAIGDVILTTPFIRTLKKSIPEAQIDYLLEPFVAPVLYGNPYINKILVFKRRSIKKELPVVAKMRSDELKDINSNVLIFQNNFDMFLYFLKNRYDIVFDLWGNLRTIIISLFSGAKYRAGFIYKLRKFFYNIPVVPDVVPKYNVYYYLDLLKPFDIKEDNCQTEIYYSKQDEQYILDFISRIKSKKSKIIGINPMGSWITKRWPEDKFIELISELLKKILDIQIILIWGPGEYETVSKIKSYFQENEQVLIVPETNINQLAALIKNIDILITNDGAPKHIAVATGTKTVTIYGPTNYKSWGLVDDPKHLYIFSGINCAPCDKMICKDRNIECMKEIKIADVLEKIKLLI
jgi:ADP-heptose:LPS heptosyltransferase